MRRTSAEDETHRGDDRPTLPHIRDLFGSKFLLHFDHAVTFVTDCGHQRSCLNPYILIHRMLPCPTPLPLISASFHSQMKLLLLLLTVGIKGEAATRLPMGTLHPTVVTVS
jgi:hypothetical protein